MATSYRKFYLFTLITTIVLCSYPLYMGVKLVAAWAAGGAVTVQNYTRYVIPYAPISLALLAVIPAMPLFGRLPRRLGLPLASAAAAALFLIPEILMEKIPVVESLGSASLYPVESWQYSLCVATPEVLRTIGSPLFAQGNPAFKIHFYLIALLIVLSSVHTVHGWARMLQTDDRTKKRPLAVQSVSLAVFVGLCVYACFTAFYRNGTLTVPPISAFLMSLFFIVFGVTAGAYAGCVFYGKRRFLSIVLPALTACAVTLVMYAGELILMGNVLFRFGEGAFFRPVGSLPFAAADYFVIVLSGAVTCVLMVWLNRSSADNPALAEDICRAAEGSASI